MTRQILVLATASSLLFTACQSNLKVASAENKNSIIVTSQNETKSADVSFTVAKNYFVNNNVIKLDNPKIETAENFNTVFGMAPLMGAEGKPTEIDFTNQYVIAVVLPETNLTTTIEPVSLQKNTKNEITLTYKYLVGQSQSFTTRPNFAIIVKRSENGNILLKEIK